jgi:hypothetical protein
MTHRLATPTPGALRLVLTNDVVEAHVHLVHPDVDFERTTLKRTRFEGWSRRRKMPEDARGCGGGGGDGGGGGPGPVHTWWGGADGGGGAAIEDDWPPP